MNGRCNSKFLPKDTHCTGCPPVYKGKLCASTTRYNDQTKGACGCGPSDPVPKSWWTLNRNTAALNCKSLDVDHPLKSWCPSGCGGCYKLCSTGSTTQGNKTKPNVCEVFKVTNRCGDGYGEYPMWCSNNISWKQCQEDKELCMREGSTNWFGYPAHFDLMDFNLQISDDLGWDNVEVTFEPVHCSEWKGPDWDCMCNTSSHTDSDNAAPSSAPPPIWAVPGVAPQPASPMPIPMPMPMPPPTPPSFSQSPQPASHADSGMAGMAGMTGMAGMAGMAGISPSPSPSPNPYPNPNPHPYPPLSPPPSPSSSPSPSSPSSPSLSSSSSPIQPLLSSHSLSSQSNAPGAVPVPAVSSVPTPSPGPAFGGPSTAAASASTAGSGSIFGQPQPQPQPHQGPSLSFNLGHAGVGTGGVEAGAGAVPRPRLSFAPAAGSSPRPRPVPGPSLPPSALASAPASASDSGPPSGWETEAETGSGAGTGTGTGTGTGAGTAQPLGGWRPGRGNTITPPTLAPLPQPVSVTSPPGVATTPTQAEPGARSFYTPAASPPSPPRPPSPPSPSSPRRPPGSPLASSPPSGWEAGSAEEEVVGATPPSVAQAPGPPGPARASTAATTALPQAAHGSTCAGDGEQCWGKEDWHGPRSCCEGCRCLPVDMRGDGWMCVPASKGHQCPVRGPWSPGGSHSSSASGSGTAPAATTTTWGRVPETEAQRDNLLGATRVQFQAQAQGQTAATAGASMSGVSAQGGNAPVVAAAMQGTATAPVGSVTIQDSTVLGKPLQDGVASRLPQIFSLLGVAQLAGLAAFFGCIGLRCEKCARRHQLRLQAAEAEGRTLVYNSVPSTETAGRSPK